MGRPQALVYRGPAAVEGASEAVAKLLESSPRHFEVRFAGPKEATGISADTLKSVDLFAQPGGEDLDDAFEEVREYSHCVRDFVSNGGRYLGFCLGAYLAGHTPGYGLLPKEADADSEIEQRNAQVTNDDDTVIQVDWTWSAGPPAGQTTKDRWIYFQEGAVIQGLRPSIDVFILGRYSTSGGVAASLTKYGKGWVGLVGPHPEATQAWFDDEEIEAPDGLQFEIGYDLIEATMAGGPSLPAKEL